MEAARVRVAIHSRLNGEENGAPDKVVLELVDKESSPVYIMFTSFVVDKAYFDAFEFLSAFKDQEDSIKQFQESGVAEFDFISYNKFTIQSKKEIDELFERMDSISKEKLAYGI